MKEWKVFYNRETGEELVSYTIQGESPGEERATKELLASENGLKVEQISTRTERR